MSADVLPAGDSGEHFISRPQLMAIGSVEAEALEVLLQAEVEKRALDISIHDDPFSGGLIVRWRSRSQRTTTV